MDLSNPLASLLPANEARVLRVLARLEAPVSGRQVHALAAEGSYSGVRLALERLSAHGLVSRVASTSAINYSINRAHLLWPPVLEILESRTSLLHTAREVLASLTNNTRTDDAPSVFLYGSVARAESTASSDIDLGVVYLDAEQKERMRDHIEILMSDLERRTGNAVQLYDVTRDELDAMVGSHDPIVDSWLADHVTLAGVSVADLVVASPT